ncbi:YfbU family protein [Metabacillus dongyingensis]|uniref:YfbU family protein n=1 Tax=Metabacillus dongyingensis TaxID=2874282 RepID=UPI003B8E8C29
MELTKYERLNLINQYKILEKLYPEEANDYKLLRTALEEGYVLNYNDSFHWMEEELSKENCREVLDILNMYRTLTFSYRDLNDKGNINESDVIFPGFDGNHETGQYVYAKYYIFDLDRYHELHDKIQYPDFNSHRGMLNKYRRMLSVYNQLNDKHSLNAEEIRNVLEA